LYSFRNPIAPISAIADNGEDITQVISQRVEDKQGYDPLICNWYRDTPLTSFYSWYDKTLHQDAPLVLSSGNMSIGNWKAQEITLNFPYTEVQGQAYLIMNADKCSYSVWVKDKLGVKQKVDEISLHERWTDTLIPLPSTFRGEVFIRREIDNPKISYVALTTEIIHPVITRISPISATNQDGFDILSIVGNNDNLRYKMEKGDYVDFKYQATSSPSVGQKKSYLVKCKGFYHAAFQSIYGQRLNPIL
jgi:hypothetical protein